jgi:hypothetical protein
MNRPAERDAKTYDADVSDQWSSPLPACGHPLPTLWGEGTRESARRLVRARRNRANHPKGIVRCNSLSSVENGGEGRGEEALGKLAPICCASSGVQSAKFHLRVFSPRPAPNANPPRVTWAWSVGLNQ